LGKATKLGIELFKKKDELDTLEYQRKVLEEKSKIKELEEKLGIKKINFTL